MVHEAEAKSEARKKASYMKCGLTIRSECHLEYQVMNLFIGLPKMVAVYNKRIVNFGDVRTADFVLCTKLTARFFWLLSSIWAMHPGNRVFPAYS